jgi:hypothetical protein
MRLPPPKLPPANSLVMGSQFAMFGPRVPPGTYTVKLIQGDKTYSSQVRLVPDPRSSHSEADRAAQHETVMALYGMLGRLTYVAETVETLRDAAQQRAENLPPGDRLRQRLGSLAGALRSFRATLAATSEGGWLSGEEQLRERMATVYGAVNGFDGRPSKSQLDQVKVLSDELGEAEARLEALRQGEVQEVNRELARRKLEPLTAKSREEWEKEDRGTVASAGFLPFLRLPLLVAGGL